MSLQTSARISGIVGVLVLVCTAMRTSGVTDGMRQLVRRLAST